MEMHSADKFSQSFEYASGATGERFQNPLWQVTEIFTGSRFRKSIAEVKRFGAEIVTNAVNARASKSHASEWATGSLIHSLLDSISDQQMVADAALNYLSAGRDTTAQALTWTFYLLMRNPQVVNRIRDETRPLVVSTTESKILQPSVLPYTMAVFYETLRLYPPVPFEIKQCEEPTTLPDGTFLPASSVVVWCTWAMNRSELIWGEDAHVFRPERWLEDGKLISKTAFEYPVFNGGPRTCLGKRMAESVAVMVIAKLIWEFEFVLGEQKERISKNSLTLPMEGGLPCRVKIAGIK
jgi:cytochrome P450